MITQSRKWQLQLGQGFMTVGMFVLALSALMAFWHKEPFYTWFYCWAWWSFIFFVDGWVFRRRGESLILSHPGRFLFFVVWSIPLWLIFEAFNFRLGNWHYVQVPQDLTWRWIGYCLGFATVVPGLMETADLLDTAGFFREAKIKPLGWKKRIDKYLLMSGLLMLALPLIWPQYFFPLVWCAFVCLLEPFNEHMGLPSLMTDWREGRVKRFFILITAGFLCGILWESLNALAGAHWVYTIPFVGNWKLFEMPVLGYLGFLPFALSVFAMTVFSVHVWERASVFVRFVLLTGLAGFSYYMCRFIDKFTVK